MSMAQFNEEQMKKCLRGERMGNVALIFCGAILVGFIVCFSVAQALNLAALRLAAFIVAPVGAILSVCFAAYCNLRYGGAIDRAIGEYVRNVFVENAALMHPDRDSLTFYLSLDGTRVNVKVNNYKEVIVFDFSVFGKLSPMRRLAVYTAIESKLSDTFCRLVVERGAKYNSVNYTEQSDKKKAKATSIIDNGVPSEKALKNFYNNR